MADFDVSKQKEFGKWEEGKHNGDLIVGVYSYNNGQPKVGFNRYIEKKDGLVITKAGRLTWDDLQFIESIWEDIKQTMEEAK
jgi:hypothetical protein